MMDQPTSAETAMRLQFKDGTERLTRAYPSLSRQLKKCAAYILEHPGDVATLSMRQVSSRADVPASTMHRLARALGMSSFNELRDIYRNGVNDFTVGYPQKAGQLQAVVGESDVEQAFDSFHRAAVGNLDALFHNVDRAAMKLAIDALTAARRVIVVGMHASFSFANYLQYVAAMGLRNWHLVSRRNGELSNQIESLTPDDAVVGIAHRPCAADTIKVAKRSRESGACVIGVTDSRTSPLAVYSTHILIAPVESPSFFESYVATTALVEVLVGMVVARGDNAIVDNIDNLERCRREMGEYWPDE